MLAQQVDGAGVRQGLGVEPAAQGAARLQLRLEGEREPLDQRVARRQGVQQLRPVRPDLRGDLLDEGGLQAEAQLVHLPLVKQPPGGSAARRDHADIPRSVGDLLHPPVTVPLHPPRPHD